MEPKVVEYLRSNPLESLAERFHILIRRHREFPSLVMLKYNQIESPMDEALVQECRGIILDEARGWQVVSFPYTKFFNYGEPRAPAIDWGSAVVYEKLDGSLMTLYWHEGQWRVASSGLPDAGGGVANGTTTFAELFWRVWGETGMRLPPRPPVRCYMFELLTPLNRVIVPQSENRIVLHGARDLQTLEELPPEGVAAEYGWPCVKSFSLASVEEVLASCNAIDPRDAEGYVVRDGSFRRVKVKSPQYVAMAYIKEHCNKRRLIEIIRAGESAEFLAYFPELRPAYDSVERQFAALCAEVEAAYQGLKAVPSQKDFAAEALKTRCSGPLFSLRAGKCKSVREFFATATLPSLERLIEFDERLLAGAGAGE